VRSAGNYVERLAAVGAVQQDEVWFENLVLVLGVDNQIAEIKRTPHHEIAGIEFGPACTGVVRAIESPTFFSFDVGIDDLWL